MERIIESTMYASRWLLAPIYLGLSLAVLLLGIKFFQEAIHIFPLVLSMKEADLVLVILSLVDLALVGGLLVMVMLSGYENFVSAIDLKEGQEKLSWLGKLDSGSLKQKVAASIVAILVAAGSVPINVALVGLFAASAVGTWVKPGRTRSL